MRSYDSAHNFDVGVAFVFGTIAFRDKLPFGPFAKIFDCKSQSVFPACFQGKTAI